MKNRWLYKIKSKIKMPIMAYVYELGISSGQRSEKRQQKI